jgi:hypothetical protein
VKVVKQASNDGTVTPASDRALTTVTHARIRIQQGDLATARRILRAILDAHPEHPEAVTLLEDLDVSTGAKVARPAKLAGSSEGSDVVENGDPDAPEIIVERLSRWLDRIKHNAGEGGV